MADRAHQAIDRAAEKAAPALDRVRTNVHNTVDKVADSAATGVGWAAENTKVLLEILERHMQEENERTCAMLEEHFTDEEREALGRRFTAAKARLNMKLKAA
jgi:hypothetical protein